MLEWGLMPLRRYTDFNGRSRRKEYWMFALMTALIAFVLVLLLMMLGGGLGAMGGGDTAGGMLAGTGGILILLFGAGLIVPSIAVQVRRFHDQDKSGWFVLLNLIPYIGGLVVLVFMFLEGTRGDNRYGPDPKAGEA
jgi:uncharacterized membrane protein YhaH (DUF805 family)